MDLLENEKSENVNSGKKKIVLGLLTFCVILLVVLVAVMFALPTEDIVEKIQVIYNDNLIKNDNLIITTDDGNKYIALKDISDILGYTYCNGAYLEYSEDKTKCYVESESQVVGFEDNSKKIYKSDKDIEKGYEFFELENEIITVTDKLYINIEDLAKAINVVVTNSNKEIKIWTAEKMAERYKQSIEKQGYTSIDIDGDNAKMPSYNMMIVAKGEKKGIINFSLEEVVGIKYDTILFNEVSQEFIVSNSKKYGIISTDGKVNLRLIYDDIQILSYDPLLYLVKINDKYGVLNKDKATIANTEYDNIGKDKEIFIKDLSEELKTAIIVEKNKKYGLIEATTGELILTCNFDEISKEEENGKETYIVKKDDQKYLLSAYIEDFLSRREKTTSTKVESNTVSEENSAENIEQSSETV